MIKAETTEPIKCRSNTDLLNMYVSENNGILQTDGQKLFCKICNIYISYATKYLVHRHFKAKKHQQIILKKNDGTENKNVSENAVKFDETDGEMLCPKVCNATTISIGNTTLINHRLQTQKHKTNCEQSVRRAARDAIKEQWAKNQDFCKTCLKQFSKRKQMDDKQSISEKPAACQSHASIMELLISIQPQIKVEIRDNLPTFMCSDCIKKLIVCYEFIEMYRNSNDKLRTILEKFDEHEEKMTEKRFTKYGHELEQIYVDSAQKVKSENGIEQAGIENISVQVLAESTENEDTAGSNHNSDEDWTPNESSCFNISHKQHNSDDDDDDDDVTKKVFKGFFQPEENEDGSLTCNLCESVLGGVLSWREHIRQHHLEEKPKRAYNRRSNKPRKKGSEKVPLKILPNERGLYQCEHCEKSYPKYLFYRRHLRIHTEGTHLCIECGKSFSNITSYKSHMLRHKGEKKFECTQCPKSFVCPSDLYGHMMTHTNNKPYICDICGAAFRMPYQLRNHNRVHTDIKNYKCEYCEMRFKSRPNQICHMRTHTGEKPFRCKYCEKAFAQSGDCVKHMRQHFGDNNVYQCDLCPLRFPLVRDLRTHFASHKNEDGETRDRNLQARMEEEQNLKIKFGFKKSG